MNQQYDKAIIIGKITLDIKPGGNCLSILCNVRIREFTFISRCFDFNILWKLPKI